jgi:beta-glucosidase
MSQPRLSRDRIREGEAVDVSVNVQNTGSRAGDEVVQVYVRDLVASVTRPVRELKAFKRVSLAPGETKTVTLSLPAEAFSFWNQEMQRVVEPGDFEILVGSNSEAVQSATLTIVAG